MIWNDRMIREWAQAGGVTPFDPALVNPASLDLRLGRMVRIPHPIWERLSRIDLAHKISDGSIDTLPRWTDPIEFETYWLMPKQFVLLHSLEYVRIPPTAASILVLKSSQGRLGINHSHSGWGDPGFGYPMADEMTNDLIMSSGAQWTFEIQNISPWPIKLTAGKPLIQMVLMDMADAPSLDYRFTGHYTYQSGPTVAHTEAHR